MARTNDKRIERALQRSREFVEKVREENGKSPDGHIVPEQAYKNLERALYRKLLLLSRDS